MKYTFEVDYYKGVVKVYIGDKELMTVDVPYVRLTDLAKDLYHLGSVELYGDRQRELVGKLILIELAKVLYYFESEHASYIEVS